MRSGLLRRAFVTILLTKKGNAPFDFFFPLRFLFFPLHFLSSSECSTSKRSIQTLNLYLYDWR